MNIKSAPFIESFIGRLSYAQVALDFVSPIRAIANWPDYILDALRLKKEPYIIYRLKNGICYKTRSGTLDRAIVLETNVRHVYNPLGFEIGPDDTVVDIGAQAGTFTVLAANAAKNGRVIAFEPEPNNHALLMENVALNKLHNVAVSQKAVTNRAGKATLYVSSNNTGGHSFSVAPTMVQKTAVTVRTTTFADIVRDHDIDRINFLKIDAEGAEYAILFELQDTILRKIDKISMEFHQIDSQKNGASLRAFLERNKFEVVIPRHLPGAPIGMLYAKNLLRQ
jgi:FkbM family methyltransferase